MMRIYNDMKRKGEGFRLLPVLVGAVLLGSCQMGYTPETAGPAESMDQFVEYFAPAYRMFQASTDAAQVAGSSVGASATLTAPDTGDISIAYPTVWPDDHPGTAAAELSGHRPGDHRHDDAA
jgi:hypothetical protein